MALVVVGLFVALAEARALGPVGHAISRALAQVVGLSRFALPLLLIGLAVIFLVAKVDVDRPRVGWSLALGLVGLSGLFDLNGGRPTLNATSGALAHGGGWLGVIVGGSLARVIGVAGAVVVLVAVLVVTVMIATSVGLRALVSGVARALRAGARVLAGWWSARPVRDVGYADAEEAVPDSNDGVDDWHDSAPAPAPAPAPAVDEEDFDAVDAPETTVDEFVHEPADEWYESTSDDVLSAASRAVEDGTISRVEPPSHWELPSLGLLQRTKDQRQDRALIEAAGGELVEALAAHGVDTTLLGFTVGPTVTRFELELGPGVKVARVTSLNKDIAYAMASPDVRILAPIPGRSAIGVEVPNRQRTLVALGDLLNSEEATGALHPLDVPIGRDISGKTVVVNLGEMPHVLISGATGAGKSSCINSLITALVMRATPDQLRLLLIDPKRVEMGQYNDLPHLLAPVVVDPKKAAGALSWAVREMERRYDLLAESGARDLTSYQLMLARGELQPGPSDAELIADVLERAAGVESDVEPPPGPETLPYIVIVVDELNDLMMVAARDVEESVVRIAQMARAVGIHLVLATQRPSVDVITGVIKANIPSRMAFAVSSLADSRVILDQAGAERLIGKGDMLMVTASSNVARRLQSPWVSEEEVRRVVESWRAQGGRRESVVALDVPTRSAGGGSGSGDDDDEVLRQARELVIRTQSGSTSMLQRKLRVGFARAGRIMDQLENEGVVAPGDGSKARKVLVTPDEYEQQTSL
ncbi:MAG: DNA translocase FtsK 4TM domain-containing protein [Acidobacteriota bacterium]|nr:DNA translocase FtsK 4TM domain-containing protein [Acidobacteriota bacterium]